MDIPIWQALIPLLIGGVIAALPKILTVRSQNRQTDAKTINESYALVIDQLKSQMNWQAGEVTALRDQVTELMRMVNARDEKIGALQAENVGLRERVTSLESQLGRRRRDDPPPPPPLAGA